MSEARTPGRPIWCDGALVPWDDARVNVLCHAMQRGSLVFDVGAMRPGIGGRPLLFRPADHVARFLRSAALVGLDVKHDATALLDATLATARASGVDSALVRWSAYLPDPEADVVPAPGARATVCIAILAPGDSTRPGQETPQRKAAVRLAIARDARKAGPEVLPPQAKAAASYLGPMLAKRRALAAGFDEVVLLDGEGRIAEAPTANIFAVVGGALVTPPVERILPGITRDSVLAIARADGIPVREAHLGPGELAAADEAFLTATSLPVQPVASVDGRALRCSAVPGPVTAHVMRAMQACERGEDARFAGFTVTV